jgi:hypothetical protein
MSIEQWSRRSGEWQAVDFAGAAAPVKGTNGKHNPLQE